MPELSSEPSPLSLASEPQRVLIYGDFGRRKTTLAGTYPKPLIIDTNGGLVTLALQGKTPLRWTPEGHEDLEALYFWIRDRVEEAGDEIETIVIDTIDNLCLLTMAEITEDAVFEKKRGGKNVTLRMQFVPEPGDYYGNQMQMFRFLTALRRLGKHIVLTSSARVKDGRSSPNVSEGMERVLCDFVSVIGEMVLFEADELPEGIDDPELTDLAEDMYPVGVMLTTEVNSRATKSRYRSLKPYVASPDFEKIDALIKAEVASSTTPVKSARGRRK